jgi:hypothetical protein
VGHPSSSARPGIILIGIDLLEGNGLDRTEVMLCLVIDTYFDRGSRVVDSFTISWNETILGFKSVEYNF